MPNEFIRTKLNHLYLNLHREVSFQYWQKVLQNFSLVERKVLIKSIFTTGLELFLNKSAELQSPCLLVLILNFNLSSPIWPNLGIVNTFFQQAKNLNLVFLELLSINNGGFCEFRDLLAFFRLTWSGKNLPHRSHEFDYILMGSDCSIIYLCWRLGEAAISQKRLIFGWILAEGQEVIDVGNLAEMWANRVEEQKL